MRRKDRELSRDEALKIIDKCEYAVISCVDSKGEIFSLPLSIVRENMSIFIHGATSGGKCENFVNGRVCKIVAVSSNSVPRLSSEFFESIKDDHVKLGKYAFTTEYKSAIATSTAHLLSDKDAKLHALRLLSQKYCAAYMSAFDAATPAEVINHMNIFEFKITELSAKAKVIKTS